MDFFGILFLLLFIFSVIAFVIICRSHADLSLNFCDKIMGGKVRDLKGQVIWVVGASSGIGAAFAVAAAEQGARLVLSARTIDKLEEVKRRCLEVGQFHGLTDNDVLVLPLDVLDFDYHENRVIKVIQHFGKISVLFLCAGRSQRATWELIEPSVDRELFATNALGPVHLARRVMPYFVSQGGGHFAAVTGMQGKAGVPFTASCAASKFALHGYFESLRLESMGSGIAITMICPGPTFSNILATAATDRRGESLSGQMSSLENRLTPESVARFSLVAVAHKLEEAWIASFPFLPLLYFNQYMPTTTKRLANYLGPKIMRKLKENSTA